MYKLKDLPIVDGKPQGILVKAGQCFNFSQRMKYGKDDSCRSYNSRNSKRKYKDTDDFKIHDSDLDKNGTAVDSGLIPSIFYTDA